MGYLQEFPTYTADCLVCEGTGWRGFVETEPNVGTPQDMVSIRWVGDRYAWSGALMDLYCLRDEEDHHVTEPQAWALIEAFEEDMEGGHSPFPCLAPDCPLYAKLMTFWEGVV